MKARLTVKTKEGFYHQAEAEVRTAFTAFTWAKSELDTMPDEVDGVKGYNWTNITLEIEKSKGET